MGKGPCRGPSAADKDPRGSDCTREQDTRILGFLTACLARSVEVHSILPLEGDASDRRYLRVQVTSDRGRALRSYVVMVLDTPWQADKGMKELPFINIARYLAHALIPVPEIYSYDSLQGMLLLEDLGELTLQRFLQGRPWAEQRGYYHEAISLLLAMQALEDRPEDDSCYAMQRAFDAETFFRELLFFLEHAVEGLWRLTILPSHRRELEEQFLALCQAISPVANVFTHRDYHSRNLMVKEGCLRVLDFQDARMGTMYYDLASLLRDSYMERSDEAVFELLDHYRQSAHSRTMRSMDTSSFLEAFDRTCIQRNLKAVGTFAYQASKRGRDQYLHYIPRTLRYVRSNLAKYKDLKDLKRILGSYVKELR